MKPSSIAGQHEGSASCSSPTLKLVGQPALSVDDGAAVVVVVLVVAAVNEPPLQPARTASAITDAATLLATFPDIRAKPSC
jgi:hypothetical protein